MKFKSTFVFIVLVFIACSKENDSNKSQMGTVNNMVVAPDTAKIPLNDLGTGTFNDSTGGLYPGGANKPSGTYASDLLSASKKIVPIDTFGVAQATGKIVFISVGGSTGGKNMTALKNNTIGNPLTNPKLKLINGNNGSGQGSLNSIMNPNDPYWAHVTQILKGNKSSYRQVQVLYLETEDSTKSKNWPNRPKMVRDGIKTSLRVIKQKFPNIKVVYLLGRTRTFGNLAVVNKEPNPYYFGWACKWAIEDQINGAPGTRYKGANPVAPMVTWGFYQWADSLPRTTDGFYWRSTMTRDGMHAKNPPYQDTLALRFQNFLLTDKYAKIWFAKP